MAIRASVFIATSLDGFIARRDGALDWLPGADALADPAEDFGYGAFMASVDTLVMGRKTWEKVLTFSQWPFAGKRVVVLSRTLVEAAIPSRLAGQVELYGGALRELLIFLEASGARHLYVDGGKAIQAFIAEGLLHDITITRVPTLIGKGLPLFGDAKRDIVLTHTSTRGFGNGFVQSVYRVTA